MPEVQSVGAADYAQYQPSQYPAENYTEEYSMQPEVYDENAEQMKAASKSRLGATALALTVVGGLALWGGHAWGKKSAGNAADKYSEFLDKQAKELEKQADEVIDTTFGGFNYGKDFARKVKNALKKLRESVEGTKDEVNDGAKKAAEDAKEAAENAAK